MRQLMYTSTASATQLGEDLASILLSSRRNNIKAGVTGLLWTDGRRFLQVLEGDQDQIGATYRRICADTRHRAHVVLHDRPIEKRTFGHWAMALLDDADDKIASALAGASPEVRATFEGVIAARRAA